jgi:hypothetical protein
MTSTGYKTRGVFDRYNIVSDGDLQEATAKISRANDPGTQSGHLSVTVPQASDPVTIN